MEMSVNFSIGPLHFYAHGRRNGPQRRFGVYWQLGQTWHWAISVEKARALEGFRRKLVHIDPLRRGQWRDTFWLPFGWELSVSHQDYHKRLAVA